MRTPYPTSGSGRGFRHPGPRYCSPQRASVRQEGFTASGGTACRLQYGTLVYNAGVICDTVANFRMATIWTRPCENVQLRRRYKGLGVPTDPVWQEQLFQGLATEGMRVYTCA